MGRLNADYDSTTDVLSAVLLRSIPLVVMGSISMWRSLGTIAVVNREGFLTTRCISHGAAAAAAAKLRLKHRGTRVDFG